MIEGRRPTAAEKLTPADCQSERNARRLRPTLRPPLQRLGCSPLRPQTRSTRRRRAAPVNSPEFAALRMADAMSFLNVNGIEVIYDHVILVLKGVSLQVPEGGGRCWAATAPARPPRCAISNLLAGERGEVTKGSIELRGERIEKLTRPTWSSAA